MKNLLKLTLLSFVLVASNALQSRRGSVTPYLYNKSGQTIHWHTTYADMSSKNGKLENKQQLALAPLPSTLIVDGEDNTAAYMNLLRDLRDKEQSIGTLEIKADGTVRRYLGAPQ